MKFTNNNTKKSSQSNPNGNGNGNGGSGGRGNKKLATTTNNGGRAANVRQSVISSPNNNTKSKSNIGSSNKRSAAAALRKPRPSPQQQQQQQNKSRHHHSRLPSTTTTTTNNVAKRVQHDEQYNNNEKEEGLVLPFPEYTTNQENAVFDDLHVLDHVEQNMNRNGPLSTSLHHQRTKKGSNINSNNNKKDNTILLSSFPETHLPGHFVVNDVDDNHYDHDYDDHNDGGGMMPELEGVCSICSLGGVVAGYEVNDNHHNHTAALQQQQQQQRQQHRHHPECAPQSQCTTAEYWTPKWKWIDVLDDAIGGCSAACVGLPSHSPPESESEKDTTPTARSTMLLNAADNNDGTEEEFYTARQHNLTAMLGVSPAASFPPSAHEIKYSNNKATTTTTSIAIQRAVAHTKKVQSAKAHQETQRALTAAKLKSAKLVVRAREQALDEAKSKVANQMEVTKRKALEEARAQVANELGIQHTTHNNEEEVRYLKRTMEKTTKENKALNSQIATLKQDINVAKSRQQSNKEATSATLGEVRLLKERAEMKIKAKTEALKNMEAIWKSEARQNAALTSQIQQLTNEITIAKSRQYELSNVNGNAVKNAHRINNEAQVTIRTQIQELKRLETKLRSEKERNGELKKRQLVADSVAQKAREQMVARLKSQGEELREMRTLREQILTLKKEELPQIANEANRIRESADAKTKELAEKNAVLNKRIVELNAKLNTNAKKQAAFGKEAKKVTVMAKEKITDQSQALQEMEATYKSELKKNEVLKEQIAILRKDVIECKTRQEALDQAVAEAQKERELAEEKITVQNEEVKYLEQTLHHENEQNAFLTNQVDQIRRATQATLQEQKEDLQKLKGCIKRERSLRSAALDEKSELEGNLARKIEMLSAEIEVVEEKYAPKHQERSDSFDLDECSSTSEVDEYDDGSYSEDEGRDEEESRQRRRRNQQRDYAEQEVKRVGWFRKMFGPEDDESISTYNQSVVSDYSSKSGKKVTWLRSKSKKWSRRNSRGKMATHRSGRSDRSENSGTEYDDYTSNYTSHASVSERSDGSHSGGYGDQGFMGCGGFSFESGAATPGSVATKYRVAAEGKTDVGNKHDSNKLIAAAKTNEANKPVSNKSIAAAKPNTANKSASNKLIAAAKTIVAHKPVSTLRTDHSTNAANDNEENKAAPVEQSPVKAPAEKTLTLNLTTAKGNGRLMDVKKKNESAVWLIPPSNQENDEEVGQEVSFKRVGSQAVKVQ